MHKLIFLVGTPIVSSWGRLLSETEYQYKGYVACWINNILGEDVVQKLGLETANYQIYYEKVKRACGSG